MNRFHIAIFIGVPVFTYLLADALSCSGIDTIISVGLLHNLYAKYNLTANQVQVTQRQVSFVAHTTKQFGMIVAGFLMVILIDK